MSVLQPASHALQFDAKHYATLGAALDATAVEATLLPASLDNGYASSISMFSTFETGSASAEIPLRRRSRSPSAARTNSMAKRSEKHSGHGNICKSGGGLASEVEQDVVFSLGAIMWEIACCHPLTPCVSNFLSLQQLR